MGHMHFGNFFGNVVTTPRVSPISNAALKLSDHPVGDGIETLRGTRVSERFPYLEDQGGWLQLLPFL